MRRYWLPVILGSMVSLTSCATITQSDTQTIAVTASYDGKPVEADCSLTNDKGTYTARTPANVMVHKSGEDLSVTCKKDGLPDGLLVAISRAAGSMWGNIIFGGGVGAIIDHSRGSGYDYPYQLAVKMGESTVIDKRTESGQQANAHQQESDAIYN